MSALRQFDSRRSPREPKTRALRGRQYRWIKVVASGLEENALGQCVAQDVAERAGLLYDRRGGCRAAFGIRVGGCVGGRMGGRVVGRMGVQRTTRQCHHGPQSLPHCGAKSSHYAATSKKYCDMASLSKWPIT